MRAAMRQLHRRGAACRGLAVDAEGASLGPGGVLVERTAAGYRTLSPDAVQALQAALLPSRLPADWPFRQCRRIADALARGEVALAQIYGLYIPLPDLTDRQLQFLTKAGFNPDEPRVPAGNPDGGQWTDADGSGVGGDGDGDNSGRGGDNAGSGGGTGGGAMPLAGSLASIDNSLLGDVAPEVLTAPARLASRMSAPAAFLGTLFIPANQTTVTSGEFAGLPGLSYRYDQDTGILQIIGGDSDSTVVTIAHIDADGRFRDSVGNPIGRSLPGGGVIIDPDALPAHASIATATAAPDARAGAQEDAATDNAPKLCPDPRPDRPGARDKDIAYQQYVSMIVNGRPLGPGLAVRLTDPSTGQEVFFDDCRESDGTMIEAKGTGYAKMLTGGAMSYPWAGVEAKLLSQAQRQLKAAGARAVEWHFAELEAADYMRQQFMENSLRIAVVHSPWRWAQ